jgi:hypothetical protein
MDIVEHRLIYFQVSFKSEDVKGRMLRAGATWAIRRSSSCEDLSDGRNRWLVYRVFSAASYSRSMNSSYINFLLQQRKRTVAALAKTVQ